MQRIATFVLKIIGWKISGSLPPDVKKVVLIMAPHTSLYDFVIGRLTFWHYGYPARFLIKKEAFKWPYGKFMRALGGIPVNRQKNERMVEAIARMVKEREEIVLIITPEGTRTRVDKWKKGFYYIAQLAKVPIAMGWADYPSKRGGIGPTLYPSGDFEKDFAEIEDFYRQFKGRHPERFNLSDPPKV